MTNGYRPRRAALPVFLISLLAADVCLAASIGVLSDGRQIAELSPLSAGSAARVALEADGHTLIELGPGSLQSVAVMQTVDIVWLPLIGTSESYTSQERTNIVLYVSVHGGGLIWQGDADIYNTSDNSFLDAFGLNKLDGNFGSAIAPAIGNHPIVTGPFDTVSTIGASASYGVFASSPDVADVFVTATGTVVGCIDASTGYAGNGRAVLICDATMFGQLLLQNDHKPLLRNIIKWVEATPGYTPSGLNIETGDLGASGDIISGLHLTIAEVLASGETEAADAGTGRCFFDDVASSELPDGFLGTAVAVTTTATLPAPVGVDLVIAYDGAAVTDLGISDETSMLVYRFDSATQTLTPLATTIDADNDTASASAAGLGTFLLGAIVPTADCNTNGIPDVCEIHHSSPASGGPYYCTAECDPDCNDNGIPDACDVDNGTSEDCNANIIPDECESEVDVTVSSSDSATGTTLPSGTSTYTLCDTVDITAIPNAGYCFTHWTVNHGDAPGDPYAAETTLRVEQNKSVSATFVKLIQQQPVAAIACEDDAATFSVVVHENFAADATFQWKHAGEDLVDDDIVSGATTATLTIDPVSMEYAGAYTCVVTHDCGEATTDEVGLTVRLSPEITAQPVAKDACPGSTVTFSVTATGASLMYHWQFDGSGAFVDLTEGTGVVGTQNATLTLSNVDINDAGRYRCVVSGMCEPFVISAEVELTLLDLISLVEAPQSQFACPGEDRTFQLSAVGSGITYQWEFNGGSGYTNLVDGAHISGVTTDTLTITDIAAANHGSYRCTIAGSCGYPVTTQAVTLTVGAFLEIVTQPVAVFICPGNDADFFVSVGGSDKVYQWQFDAGAGFVDLDDSMDGVQGATAATLEITDVSAANAGFYRCIIAGSCGDDVTSVAAQLILGVEASIAAHPGDIERCPGAPAGFSVQASGSSLTYLWQFGNNGIFQNVTNNGVISGATTPTLSISEVAASHAGQYRCLVFAACGATAISNAGRLTVAVGQCDCNSNNTADATDIANGTSDDCDGNGLPDECDLASGVATDCNSNGVLDVCDIADGTSDDCNDNNVPDECEIHHTSPASGGPFYCTTECDPDCNDNGIPDACDIADGTSIDCNHNNIPDECEPPYYADAGDDIDVCLEVASQPLGADVVASGSTPPYSYAWQIISGPSGGAAILSPTAEHARLYATMAGEYEVELVVSDSSSPPCTTTDRVIVTARNLDVDAGDDIYMCAEGTSEPLSPVVIDGVAPFTYTWSLLTGSQNTSLSQFTGDGPNSESPTFTPSQSGTYILQVSVTDAGDPSCTATDTLTIHAKVVDIDAGASFGMCAGFESPALTAAVLAGGVAPLSYEWTIEYGPNGDVSQFKGAGRFALQPTFQPLAVGQYTLRLTVTDSGTPPCTATDVVTITAAAMTVDAGAEQTLCVGASGIRMSPTITGGYGTLNYVWSVESGSPSTNPGQFSDPHNFARTPLFVPAAVGNYQLKLTVTDSGTPPCVASDIVVVRATSLTVDAGDDFTTAAFTASRGLGALPVVGGGNTPYFYEWEILGGPDRSNAQFNNRFAEHPRFTPSQPGVYEISVSVDDGNGCVVSDTVVVQAVTSSLELSVNTLGRLFMDLQIDAPHTRGQIRLTQATPGVVYRGEIRDDGSTANFNGLLTTPAIARRLFFLSDDAYSNYVAVVALNYDVSELGGTDERNLRVFWYDAPQNWWRQAATGNFELGTYPSTPKAADVGRHGVDTANHCAWAVVDRLGEFCIGVSNGESPPTTSGDGTTGGASQPGDTASLPTPTGFCGAAAPAAMLPIIPLLILRRGRRALSRRRCPSRD